MIWFDFGPIRTSGSIVSTLTLHSLTGTLKGPGSFGKWKAEIVYGYFQVKSSWNNIGKLTGRSQISVMLGICWTGAWQLAIGGKSMLGFWNLIGGASAGSSVGKKNILWDGHYWLLLNRQYLKGQILWKEADTILIVYSWGTKKSSQIHFSVLLKINQGPVSQSSWYVKWNIGKRSKKKN